MRRLSAKSGQPGNGPIPACTLFAPKIGRPAAVWTAPQAAAAANAFELNDGALRPALP